MSHFSYEKDFSASRASHFNEEELIRGLNQKQEWAYRRLIDRWSDKLYRLAYRFLGTKEEAEEIVQEVLQKVVEKIETFQGNSSLYTWMYRIAVNQSLMRLRRVKGKEFLSLEDEAPEFENGIRIRVIPDWSKLPDELFEKKELYEFVQQCVSELPEVLQTAYLLKDAEGFSEEEVCRRLELTKSAMRNRVHRARLILRERLEKKYVR